MTEDNEMMDNEMTDNEIEDNENARYLDRVQALELCNKMIPLLSELKNTAELNITEPKYFINVTEQRAYLDALSKSLTPLFAVIGDFHELYGRIGYDMYGR